MNRKALKTCLGIVASALGLLLGAPGASAQTSNPPANPGDWPAFGAYQNRQGRNGDPFTYNAGQNNLRWTYPFTEAERALLTLDDTDARANFFSVTGPVPTAIDDPLYNAGSVAFTPGWRGPEVVAKEAGSPYVLPRRARVYPVDQTPAGYTTDRRDRRPSYLFTEGTPQLKGQADPTVAADPADLRYFEWTFTPPAGPDRNYGLYVYLPVGPTYTSAGTALTDRKFPQRYYVYRIFYGNGQSYTEILDTETAGSGFVRLGNGGLATQRVFPFNTVTGTPYPIRVRLYNTVPRYSDGSLAITGSNAFLDPATERNLARTRIVYADAARLRPQIGEFRASPVTQTFVPGTLPAVSDRDIDAQVTAALNVYETSTSNNTLQQSTAGTVVSYQSNPSRWPINPATDRRTTPLEVWRYALNESSTNAKTVDNVDNPGGAWTAETANPYHIGANYLQQPAVVDPANTQSLTYAPVLDDGEYSVYVYLGGSRAGVNYARSVVYYVYQGATLVDTVTLDQDRPRVNGANNAAPGWVRLGGRRYRNIRDDQDTTGSAPLRVVVTNYSTNANDLGRFVYADAVRFVGLQNSAINSTPVHATARINGTDTRVVLVADESGRIHCLDARGNDDGTTREYWSYPSTPQGADLTQYRDPNLFEIVNSPSGIDGVPNGAINPGDNAPNATMPTSFDLSSAAVKRIDRGGGNIVDYLYIGASNGRVYCIDMAGRNDSTPTTIGTTRRIWTYPNDYDPTNPEGPIGTSDLGPFRGSIVVGDATGPGGRPTVYVPAYQGRIYALDALGNGASRTTNVAWRYPEAEISPLPNIVMTPTLFGEGTANPRLFFGTLRSTADDGPGRFYCLNATTGDIVWRYNGGVDQNVADIHDTATTIRRTATDVFQPGTGYDPTVVTGEVANFGAFVTGVVAVPGTVLDQNPSTLTANPPVHVDTVYALNNNRFLYAFDAANGLPLTYQQGGTTRFFANNDLDVLSDGNLTFTVTTAPNRSATVVNGAITGELFPVILIPSNDGRMREAFARTEDYNVFEGRVAEGLNFPNPLTSAAASNNSTYLGDTEGNLYALDDKGAFGENLLLNPIAYGVNGVYPPNDPRGQAFRNLKIRLVNRTAYNALRDLDAEGQGGLTYADATANPAYQGPAAPHTFEWGETAYVLVYGFPYATAGANGASVAPPTVTITLSTEGRTVRQVQADSHRFRNPQDSPAIPGTTDPRDPSGNTPYREDGYAVIPFTFNSAGSTALPPGAGRITATLSTSSGGGGGAVEVLTDTRPGRGPAIDFAMANPLAVEVYALPNSTVPSSAIGYTTFASAEQNRRNGSPNIGGELFSQMQTSAGVANHGASGTARFRVTDRSLMALVRPEGLNNVRLQRSNLERQGGTNSAFKPLNPTLYPNFEDLGATRYRPNRSLDYPNIGREQVRAVKDPGGNAENPLLTSVTLRPPLALGGGELTEATLGANNDRQLRPTPFELTVDVPRYQPPVLWRGLGLSNGGRAEDIPDDLLHIRRDKNGAQLPQGYFGKVQVFVDSNNDQARNAGTSAEAFRSFNYSIEVAPQASILVGTPTVDLNSLAAGTGYAPLNPAAAGINASYDPWTGQWRDAYQPIVVRNDGNVNLLDLRPAKATNESANSVNTANNRIWPIEADDNDPLAYLAAALLDSHQLQPGDLWSNFDATFAPNNRNAPTGNTRVILQKPRVTDRNPTELAVNPAPRPNPNIPTNGGPAGAINGDLVRYPANSAPRVGVSIPLGFPVGNYSTDLRIVENVNGDAQVLNRLNGEYDVYSDPITLSFKVRETRLTNRATSRTAFMIDNPANFPNNTTRPRVGNAPFAEKVAFRNGGAGAMRTHTGSLVVAYPSDRIPGPTEFGSAVNPTRIFFAGVNNGSISLTGSTASADNPPLWDLNQFDVPNGATQWFTPGNGGTPFPSGGFNGLFGGNPVPETIQFDSPNFPTAGSVNPLSPNSFFEQTFMGFVGNAQVQTATGRLAASRVYLVPVSMNGATVTANDADIVAVPGDPQTAKGKPSVVQSAQGAVVFYSETSAGQSGITVSRYGRNSAGNGGNQFSAPMPLNFGDGFSSVFSPSASVRQYRNSNEGIVDLSFAGKLRGRPNAEVYLGRLRYNLGNGTLVDAQGTNIETRGAGSAFRPMAVQSLERIVNEGNGLYRARGVLWNVQAGIDLIRTGSTGSVLVPNTQQVDRQSGLMVFDSIYGGKVYLDPDLGTVKFTGGTPPRSAELRLTYTPTFLRITPGGPAGYSAVNGLWDHRYISDYNYWFNGNGGAVTPDLGIRNDRYYFAYGRGAAGNGQTARPYSTSMRLGVRLPSRVATDQEGRVGAVTVTAADGQALHPYQVDPANGRVYFQALDEDRVVTIRYTGVNEGTNATGPASVTSTVSFVLERTETPIPVEEATNDSAITAFLDPFSFPSTTNNRRERPPLIWLFYTSTRAGGPDVYFQTVAPRFSPLSK